MMSGVLTIYMRLQLSIIIPLPDKVEKTLADVATVVESISAHPLPNLVNQPLGRLSAPQSGSLGVKPAHVIRLNRKETSTRTIRLNERRSTDDLISNKQPR